MCIRDRLQALAKNSLSGQRSQQLAVDAAKTTIAHHQYLVAWLCCDNDTFDELVQIVGDHRLLAQWRQRLGGVPAKISTCLLYTSRGV